MLSLILSRYLGISVVTLVISYQSLSQNFSQLNSTSNRPRECPMGETEGFFPYSIPRSLRLLKHYHRKYFETGEISGSWEKLVCYICIDHICKVFFNCDGSFQTSLVSLSQRSVIMRFFLSHESVRCGNKQPGT